MDDLCGNNFYKNEITITTYLAGRMILMQLRKLVAKKNAGEQIIQRTKTTIFHNSAGLHSAGKISHTMGEGNRL